jgi:hypothetical protein
MQVVSSTDASCFINCLTTQPETRKLQQVCCRLDATCDHQADVRMRSHRLLRLDNIKSVASCLQTCCKLWSTDLLQVVNCRLDASCELTLDASCELQRAWCKLWKDWARKAPYEALGIHYFEQKRSDTLPYFSPCSVSFVLSGEYIQCSPLINFRLIILEVILEVTIARKCCLAPRDEKQHAQFAE